MQSGIQGSELHFVMKTDVHHTKTGGRKSDLLIAKAPKTGYVLGRTHGMARCAMLAFPAVLRDVGRRVEVVGQRREE